MLDREPFQLLQKKRPHPGRHRRQGRCASSPSPCRSARRWSRATSRSRARPASATARLGQAARPLRGARRQRRRRHDADGRRGQGRDAGQRRASPRRAGSTCSARRADKQPPLRITAVLDNSYRNQLGLDINDLVQGDVGVEVTVGPRRARRAPRAPARRPPQRRGAPRQRRLAQAQGHAPACSSSTSSRAAAPIRPSCRTSGWSATTSPSRAGWGSAPTTSVKEFRFPNFSLNVVTSLETHGKVRPDGIWEVTAKGPTYDGRDLFRSFFDVAAPGRAGREGAARASTCAPRSTRWSATPTPRCAT